MHIHGDIHKGLSYFKDFFWKCLQQFLILWCLLWKKYADILRKNTILPSWDNNYLRMVQCRKYYMWNDRTGLYNHQKSLQKIGFQRNLLSYLQIFLLSLLFYSGQPQTRLSFMFSSHCIMQNHGGAHFSDTAGWCSRHDT